MIFFFSNVLHTTILLPSTKKIDEWRYGKDYIQIIRKLFLINSGVSFF